MLIADGHSFGPFAHIVLAMPAVQAAALLPAGTAFTDALAAVRMQGCHTLVLGYGAAEAPSADWDCAHFDDAMLGFAAFNHTKPGRPVACALTLQTRHDWSEPHIEDDVDAVAAQMKTRFAELTGLPIAASGYDRIHRWRYASTATPAGQPFLHDAAMAVSAVGDWCTGSKVEDAFLSGHALATHLRG
jgi:renalase